MIRNCTTVLIIALSCLLGPACAEPRGQSYSFGDKLQGAPVGDFDIGFFVWQTKATECNPPLVRFVSGVIDYNQLTGEAKEAYKAAAEHPDLLQQLFPYSGNDLACGHKNLLDAFKSDFAIDDPLSRRQALKAVELLKQGKTIEKIQDEEEKLFARYYPLPEKKSPTLQAYNSGRKKPKSEASSVPSYGGGYGGPKLIPPPSAFILAPYSPAQPDKWDAERWRERLLHEQETERDTKVGPEYAHPPVLSEPFLKTFGERDFEAKKQVFGIKHPWQVLAPYGDWLPGQSIISHPASINLLTTPSVTPGRNSNSVRHPERQFVGRNERFNFRPNIWRVKPRDP